VTADRTAAAGEQAWVAARLRGTAEALNVLQQRSPAERRSAARSAVSMLAANVTPANWAQAGLPAPTPTPTPEAGQSGGDLVPLNHPSTVLLARTALGLYCGELRVDDRPVHWDKLVAFFERYLPETAPELVRLRERAAGAHVAANDTSPQVFAVLLDALDFHLEADGHDAYLTSIARSNLSVAYRQRRTDADLGNATVLARDEVRTRTARYGADHPVTLVARSLLTLSLLLQAEASDDEAERCDLGRQALAEINEVRVARDRLFGVTSPNATSSRRYEARALMLLGQLDRARSCLESTLTFENTHNAGQQTQSLGQTHYQLARVHRALGESARAAEHARRARQIFESNNPAGRAASDVGRLLDELSAS
jgi:tetratricopeptide (TPR) repeat protein